MAKRLKLTDAFLIGDMTSSKSAHLYSAQFSIKLRLNQLVSKSAGVQVLTVVTRQCFGIIADVSLGSGP